METKTPVTEAYVQRVLAEVEAGQRTAGAEMSPERRAIAARQIRGEITGDQAVAEVIALVNARFDLDLD